MYEIRQSKTFAKWFTKLRSLQTRDGIYARIRRMQGGHLGDCKPVGGGVYEARVHIAGGIRLYFIRRGAIVIVLLVGGDKSSQQHDINKAKEMAEDWED